MAIFFKVKTVFWGAVIGLSIITVSSCSGISSVSSDPVLSPTGTTTTFILIRHAERAKEQGDSALTPAGRERAAALAGAIGDMEITAIYCPDRGRNRETAQPLADHLSLTVNLIPEARLVNTRKFADEFVKEVLSKHPGGVVVWIGNKSPVGIWGGNLKEIYQRLGGADNGPSKYDDLFIIKVPDKGGIQITKTTYGKSAGRFDQ
jgi:hypothetical protein